MRVLRYYWSEIVWWHFWRLRETLVVLNGVTWKFGAKRSRRQEVDRSQILPAVLASVVHRRCNYVMEKRAAMVTKDRALLIGRLASRKACRLSAGHRTGRSRRSSPLLGAEKRNLGFCDWRCPFYCCPNCELRRGQTAGIVSTCAGRRFKANSAKGRYKSTMGQPTGESV